MSYRNRGSRFPGGNRTALSPRSNPFRSGRSYASEQSGLRRHQFIAAPSAPAAGIGIVAANEYLVFNIARFTRTFDAGVTDDVNPTATASNNFQSPNVMNGSKIINLNAKLKIQNTSASNSAVWDVYEVALSFYDGLIWTTLLDASCPFTFQNAGGAGDTDGQVRVKAIISSLLVTNTVKNFKFLQHYLKNRGSITLTPTDGGAPNAEINLRRFPEKVRRSQTGMMYAIILHNDSGKNDAQTLNSDASLEVSFDEIPSENRLPFID